MSEAFVILLLEVSSKTHFQQNYIGGSQGFVVTSLQQNSRITLHGTS